MSTFWTVARQLFEALESSLESDPPTRIVAPASSRSQTSRGTEDLWPETPREALSLSRPAERTERIRSEIHSIAPNFSRHEGVNYDEENCDWLMIPKYPLPEKWRARWCKLLIILPETYPIAPPIGFYLNRKFSLKDGGKDSHLIGFGHNNAPDLQEQGWFWYCVQLRESSAGGWRPSARYDQPDNLRTFFNLVREVLTND